MVKLFGVLFFWKRGYNEDVPKCVCPFSNDAFSAFFGMNDGHHGLNCSSFIAEKIPLVLESFGGEDGCGSYECFEGYKFWGG